MTVSKVSLIIIMLLCFVVGIYEGKYQLQEERIQYILSKERDTYNNKILSYDVPSYMDITESKMILKHNKKERK